MSQAQILRRMSGIARLEQAIKLSDFVRNLAMRDLKKNKLSSRQIEKELRHRFELARQ